MDRRRVMPRLRVMPRRSPALLALCALAALPCTARGVSGQQERTFRPLGPLGPESRLTASVGLGDVDGDGALDIVVANGRHWPEQNRIFLNDGRAGFTLARRLGDEEDGTYAAPLADFDGDGDLDIATGNDRTRNLVFLNDGAGRFERSGTFGTPSSTRSLTLADLDGDANTDILVVNRGRQNFIFQGDGAGAFDEGTPFGAGDDSTIDVAAADLDADGDLDLVLANRDGGANAIHWNDSGVFDRRTVYGTGSDETRGVAVGDVNGDDFADVVVANIGELLQPGHADGRTVGGVPVRLRGLQYLRGRGRRSERGRFPRDHHREFGCAQPDLRQPARERRRAPPILATFAARELFSSDPPI